MTQPSVPTLLEASEGYLTPLLVTPARFLENGQISTNFLVRPLKNPIFLKNFRNSITELFRNLRKQIVRKIPSFAGPY